MPEYWNNHLFYLPKAQQKLLPYRYVMSAWFHKNSYVFYEFANSYKIICAKCMIIIKKRSATPNPNVAGVKAKKYKNWPLHKIRTNCHEIALVMFNFHFKGKRVVVLTLKHCRCTGARNGPNKGKDTAIKRSWLCLSRVTNPSTLWNKSRCV